jgi:hypothetical protein
MMSKTEGTFYPDSWEGLSVLFEPTGPNWSVAVYEAKTRTEANKVARQLNAVLRKAKTNAKRDRARRLRVPVRSLREKK